MQFDISKQSTAKNTNTSVGTKPPAAAEWRGWQRAARRRRQQLGGSVVAASLVVAAAALRQRGIGGGGGSKVAAAVAGAVVAAERRRQSGSGGGGGGGGSSSFAAAWRWRRRRWQRWRWPGWRWWWQLWGSLAYSGQSHQAQLACLVLLSFLTGHEELSSKRFLLVLTTTHLKKDTYLWNKKEIYL
jgi:hypothetical protein